jgi:two-component system NtrC family sensor kinase
MPAARGEGVVIPGDPEKFLDLSPDLMCIASSNGHFSWVNASFTRVLGWSTEELLSRPAMDFIHPDDWESLRDAMRGATEGSIMGYENRYICKDGSFRRLRWNAIFDADRVYYALGRDITEEKKNDSA